MWEQKGNNGLGVGTLPASFRVVPESDLHKMTHRNMIDGAIEYIPRKTKEDRPITVRVPLNGTGRGTLAELTRRCPRSRMVDHAQLFRDYKDLNDFWIARKRHRDDSEEAKTESRKPQLRPKGGMKV